MVWKLMMKPILRRLLVLAHNLLDQTPSEAELTWNFFFFFTKAKTFSLLFNSVRVFFFFS